MKKQNGITLIALIITIIVMLILVGVTVNVALNGGLFDAARQAASGMNMAQIREKAEMTKVVLIADAQADSGVIADIPTYRDRLLEEFDVKETDTDGNSIIEVNDKYVIIIKNSDLDIEIAEKTNIPANYLLVSLGYKTSNFEENGKIYGTNVALNITRLMDQNQYTDLKKEQETTVSDETKKQAFLQCCTDYFGPEEPFTSIDEAVLYDINDYYGYGPFETIEEAIQDETLQADWGTITSKEQLYYYLLNDLDYYPEVESESMTEQEVINYYYEEEQSNIYNSEYSKYTYRTSLYVAINGVEQETPIEDLIDMRNVETKIINHGIGQNGTYEFILKTRNGEEIAREVLRVNNITTEENPYYITEEEAQDVWTTDGAGTITGYTGTDTDVVVPLKIGGEMITTVGGFKGNTNITSVTIPEGFTKIQDGAFGGCTNLTDITIPEGVTTIGHETFNGCTNLTNIKIPKGVTSIGVMTFKNCKSLTNIIIPEGLTSIGNTAFSGCSNLTSITIPNSVTSIENYAFVECTRLANITIPENVTFIGKYAFYSCKSLTNITIPEGVIKIDEYTFNNCTSLTSVTLPNSVTSIVSTAFNGCINLTAINFAAGDNDIPAGQYWGVPNENVQVIKLGQEPTEETIEEATN